MLSEEAISLLVSQLNERDKYQNILQELISLGTSAVPSLIGALTNSRETPEVCVGAARALGEIRDERAIAPLLSVCNLTNEEGDPLDYLIVPALANFGASALPHLIAALTDRKQDVLTRSAAAWALGMLGEPQILELLVERLRDVNEASRVRSHAADGLGKLGDRRAVAPLMEMLSWDVDADLRQSIARALGFLEDARAVEHLIRVLQTDQDTYVQYFAARALGQINDERAISPLIEFITRNIIPSSAAEALEQFGAPALHALLDALQQTDDKPLARQSLVRALGHFKQEEALTKLLFVLTDEHEDCSVRSEAAWALGSQRSQRASEPLLALLKNHKNSSLCVPCAIALGMLGDRQALPALQELLQNEDIVAPWGNTLKKAAEISIERINMFNH